MMKEGQSHRKIVYVSKNRVGSNFLLVAILLVFLFLFIGCQAENQSLENAIPIENESDMIEKQNVIHLTNGNWPPYNGEALPGGGCDSQVVSETFALAGYEVEYGYFPWARSYAMSQAGEWDGTVAWDDTPAHRNDHWSSDKPTSIQQWVFFYRASDKFAWTSLNELHGKLIGTTTGYVYSDAFSEIMDDANITFIESTTDQANFKMLLAGRIDIFPMEKNVGLYLLKEQFSADEQKQITFFNKPISEFHSHLLLSKANPENEMRMIAFDKAFQELLASGRYDEIMQYCESTGE